ncbi:hypothetical protein HK097_001115 [Rhizophlyctis rosea]|uniref:Response regulatory domain-containing protein n=1 Tax=Rhizophlyctis rosea TaxID=64517 RepID=A0AAD5S4U4_9FUNG|nr:hypothetical protein HK097_001115 [Rhizophlyctis rosea]
MAAIRLPGHRTETRVTIPGDHSRTDLGRDADATMADLHDTDHIHRVGSPKFKGAGGKKDTLGFASSDEERSDRHGAEYARVGRDGLPRPSNGRRRGGKYGPRWQTCFEVIMWALVFYVGAVVSSADEVSGWPQAVLNGGLLCGAMMRANPSARWYMLPIFICAVFAGTMSTHNDTDDALTAITYAAVDVIQGLLFLLIIWLFERRPITFTTERETMFVLLASPASAAAGGFLRALVNEPLDDSHTDHQPLNHSTLYYFGALWAGSLISCPLVLSMATNPRKLLTRWWRHHLLESAVLLILIAVLVGLPFAFKGATTPDVAFYISMWDLLAVLAMAGIVTGVPGIALVSLVSLHITTNATIKDTLPPTQSRSVPRGLSHELLTRGQIGLALTLSLVYLIVVLRYERNRAFDVAERAMKARAKRNVRESQSTVPGRPNMPIIAGEDGRGHLKDEYAGVGMLWLGYLCRELKKTLTDVIRMDDAIMNTAQDTIHRTATPGHKLSLSSQCPSETDISVHREAHAQFGSARAIKRLSEHALGLTNDALDLVRIATGKMQLNPAIADIHEIFDASIAAARTEVAATRRMDVQAVMKCDFPQWVLVDPIRFRHVLEILIANACKFASGNEPTIVVEADTVEGSQSSESSSNGPNHAGDIVIRLNVTIADWALTTQQADMLLHPYYYQSISTADLSLAVAEGLASLMSGTFTIQSPNSRSTTFTFSVPLRTQPPPPGPMVLPATTATLDRHIRMLGKTPSRALSEILLQRNEIVAGHDTPEGMQIPTPIVSSRCSSRTGADGGRGGLGSEEVKSVSETPKKSPLLMKLQQTVQRATSSHRMSLGPIFTANSLNPDNISEHSEHLATPPVVDLRPTTPPAPENPDRTSTPPPKTILLVDDSSINRAILSKICKLHFPQFTTHEVNNGADAVEKCMSSFYEMIFMDLEMPQMGGQEATRRLRQGGIVCPIIVLTAHNVKAEQVAELKEIGVTEVLAKPITRTKVADVLHRFLGVEDVGGGKGKDEDNGNGGNGAHGAMGANVMSAGCSKSRTSTPTLPQTSSIERDRSVEGQIQQSGWNNKTQEPSIDRRAMLILTRTGSPASEQPILIVDDDIITRALTKRILGKLVSEREVMEAENGSDAVMLCAKAISFALILMDLEMPRMDGDVAATRIRNLYPAGQCPPIVAMTAHHLNSETINALQHSGINEIIVKPPTRDAITKILQTYRVMPTAEDDPTGSIRAGTRRIYTETYTSTSDERPAFPHVRSCASDESISSRGSLDNIQLPFPPKPSTPTPVEAMRGGHHGEVPRRSRSPDLMASREGMRKHRPFSQSQDAMSGLRRAGGGNGTPHGQDKLNRRETVAGSEINSGNGWKSPDGTAGLSRMWTLPREMSKSPSIV